VVSSPSDVFSFDLSFCALSVCFFKVMLLDAHVIYLLSPLPVQMAGFSAVIMGVLVSASGIMPEPTATGAQHRAGIGEVGIVDYDDEANSFWPGVRYDDDTMKSSTSIGSNFY
jgi:hypothetical protein